MHHIKDGICFLRWMVRFDTLDLGLWKKIDKKDLILPLDTHTFKVSQKIGTFRKQNLQSKICFRNIAKTKRV